MANPDKASGQGSQRRNRLWVTFGELVGLLALVITGLNYWESHRQHTEEARREQVLSQAQTAFVATGEADSEGRIVPLRPLKATQAIQSQRYRFPAELVGHPFDLTAERPRIELDWIAGGLRRELEAAHARSSGAGQVPVVIETTYVEDGEARADVSLYEVGFTWKREFLAGRQVRLTGVALVRRGVGGDRDALLEHRWRAAAEAMAPPPAAASAG